MLLVELSHGTYRLGIPCDQNNFPNHQRLSVPCDQNYFPNHWRLGIPCDQNNFTNHFCRLLLNMYLQQKMRIRWNATFSEYFTICNGVKQGGVISPVLFCIDIDGLLIELENSGVGCYMGSVFAGLLVMLMILNY